MPFWFFQSPGIFVETPQLAVLTSLLVILLLYQWILMEISLILHSHQPLVFIKTKVTEKI